MRQVVKILPNRTLYRENLALYSAYSGDFAAAEQEVKRMQKPGLFGLLALAFAQLGHGQLPRRPRPTGRSQNIDALGRRMPRPALATWRCTKVGLPMPRESSRKARRPT